MSSTKPHFDGLNLVLHSSLPRSGSTLLQNLLAQNPLLHCTPTNAVLDQLVHIRDRWMGAAEFIGQGLRNIEPRIRRGLAGFLGGFYASEIAAGKTIIDKSRGWLSQLRLIEDVLQRPVKVIVCVRDIRDILASFEKIYRRSTLSDHPLASDDALMRLTVEGRSERLLLPRNTLGFAVASLCGALESGLQERLVIVPYRELTFSPVLTVRRVCQACGIVPFNCDPTRVEQRVQEDDAVYGMYDLHRVRPAVEPDAGGAWRGILPQHFAEQLLGRYAAIQAMAEHSFLTNSAK